jgi:hypothetical protein
MKKAQFRSAIETSERNKLNSGLTSIIPMLKNKGEDIPARFFCVEKRLLLNPRLKEEEL